MFCVRIEITATLLSASLKSIIVYCDFLRYKTPIHISSIKPLGISNLDGSPLTRYQIILVLIGYSILRSIRQSLSLLGGIFCVMVCVMPDRYADYVNIEI